MNTQNQIITRLNKQVYSNILHSEVFSLYPRSNRKMAAELSIIALFLFLPLAKLDNIDEARRNVLQAVSDIVDFYALDYQNLNVDGLFGLRVVEGNALC